MGLWGDLNENVKFENRETSQARLQIPFFTYERHAIVYSFLFDF